MLQERLDGQELLEANHVDILEVSRSHLLDFHTLFHPVMLLQLNHAILVNYSADVVDRFFPLQLQTLYLILGLLKAMLAQVLQLFDLHVLVG